MKPYTVKEYRVQSLGEREPIDYLCDTPAIAAQFWREQIAQNPYVTGDVEVFIGLMLNTRRRIIGWHIASLGLVDTCIAHPREVFRPAIVANASAVILMHNHPSGDPTPSEADIRTTRDQIKAGQVLKIDVLDHVIIGRRTVERLCDHVSLRELGYFYS